MTGVFAIFIVINIIITSIAVSPEEGSCATNKKTDNCSQDDLEIEVSSRYSSAWSQFLNERNAALEEYHSSLSSSSSEDSPEDGCNYLSRVDTDLDPWKETGITKDLIEKAKRFGVHYEIKEGILKRNGECIFPARCEGVEHFLHQIQSNITDCEFVVNYHDYPQIPRGWNSGKLSPIPVFSFSKTDKEYDIMYPAWAFFSGGPAIDLYPRGIGDWETMRESIGRKRAKWADKKNLAFFRGSRTSPERDPLILLSRSHPELIDAQFTKNQAWKSPKDTLGSHPAPTISFEDQCDYKYLINLRGVAASFRYKHLFLCKSTVLNVESDWIEFFYPFLKPWVHYVPVASDMHDLKEKILFLKHNDDVAKEIAEAGQHFIYSKLTIESVTCYWRHLMNRYTQLLKY